MILYRRIPEFRAARPYGRMADWSFEKRELIISHTWNMRSREAEKHRSIAIRSVTNLPMHACSNWEYGFFFLHNVQRVNLSSLFSRLSTLISTLIVNLSLSTSLPSPSLAFVPAPWYVPINLYVTSVLLLSSSLSSLSSP